MGVRFHCTVTSSRTTSNCRSMAKTMASPCSRCAPTLRPHTPQSRPRFATLLGHQDPAHHLGGGCKWGMVRSTVPQGAALKFSSRLQGSLPSQSQPSRRDSGTSKREGNLKLRGDEQPPEQGSPRPAVPPRQRKRPRRSAYTIWRGSCTAIRRNGFRGSAATAAAARPANVPSLHIGGLTL